jgi:photosystem II stability/assembly factor-like uncharacterized protein
MRKRYLLSILPIILFACMILLITGGGIETRNREAAEAGGRTGAMAALDFWTQARAYPDNDIPRAAYYTAYAKSLVHKNEIPRTMTAGSIWDPLGPLNLQGRCLSIAVNPLNPNTILVGTASGGLWRSHTGGTGGDWQQVMTGFPVLGVGSVAIDPTDTNTIYIGTGEVYRYRNSTGGLVLRTTRGSYGVGILRTTNGGTSWTKSLDWSLNQQTGVQVIRINPHNHLALWAGTSEGIYRSYDGGAHWTNLFPGLQMVEDIQINPVDTGKVMFSFGNFDASTIFVTTDGGSNWAQSPIPAWTGKTLLELYGANPNSVYATAADSTSGAGAVYKSTDFGTSWSALISYGVNGSLYQVQGWYSHFVAVHPTDSLQVVHAGVPPYKSTDGGSTFFGASGGYSDNHGFAHHPFNPNILYVVNDDGVYRSDNFGASYVNIGFGMQCGQFYNGFSCSSSDSLIALGQSQDHIPGYIYQGGSVWQNSAVDEVGFTSINPTNDNIMWAISRYGESVYRSTNRGASFNYVFGTGTDGAWNSPIMVAPSNPNIVYCATTRIYRTTTGGSSWTTLTGILDAGNTAISMAVAPRSSDTVFVGMAPVGTTAHIFRTTNGGSAWTNVTGTLPNRYPIDLAVDPSNSAVVYATYGGFGGGHVYKSTDAGGTWTNISGTLPDVPTTAVVIDPLHPSTVYAGNDLGVYVSTNGGTSWSGFSEGLPDAVIVADLTISPSNRALRVATHGNGVWERKLLGELPANYFDYKATSMNLPADGGSYNLGTSFSSLTASFRNISSSAQTDSFNVSYTISRGGTPVYSAAERVAGLGLGETRPITFNPGFTPTDTATFSVEVISLAGDNNPSNDTLRGTFNILSAPSLYNFVQTNAACTYQEISGGTTGPVGDDIQQRIALPFTFRYDGALYDSAQISTNGWLELGTGAPGSLRGLSTDGQIGSYFRMSLNTTDHPTKTIGPWYTDLLADGSPGQVLYTTTGTAPDRTFIVEWKDAALYGTTTYLNFQIQLHETSNDLEIDYGPMTAGSASGTGAAMGLKDYIGGEGRYYDILKDSVGTAATFRTDLNALTDWPGPDRCYHIQTNPSGVAAHVTSGWNLVSNPVSRSDNSPHTLFPTAISNAFRYQINYQIADSILPGRGYWLKFPGAASQQIPGNSISTIVDSVTTGWNLIGSVDHSVNPPSGGIVTGKIFEFTGHYQIATSIDPGKGYWLKSTANGTVLLGGSILRKSEAENFEGCSSITVTDRLGNTQTLYLTDNHDGTKNASSYELPPLPPDGLFDVRFGTSRLLENYPPGNTASSRFDLVFQGATYPVTVSYSLVQQAGVRFSLERESAAAVISSRTITGAGSVTLNSGETASIRVTGSAAVPSEFALHQNYPNPFNPATAVEFDVPVQSTVSIVVYDVLGKEVTRIAGGVYDAGTYSVHTDFSSFASGIYLCRMEGQPVDRNNGSSFRDVRKMVFVK